LHVRALDLDDPDDVALGRALVEEYVSFTVDEAIDVLGAWPSGDAADVHQLVPDLRDFTGRYRDGSFLVATADDRDGQIAGGVGITRIDERVCEMNRLWIRPDFQGGGSGRTLVAGCLDRARGMGFSRMILDAAPYRERAIALYRSFGFADAPPIHTYPFEMVSLALDL
jgi:GNAT superfamily N-acetyltransferase